MSKNVVPPKSVSFEDALRNLASRLTGQPAAVLPRTQEGVVQFMAENIPTADELAEDVTREVLARMAADTAPVNEGGSEDPGRSAPVAADKPKRGSKAKTAK